MSEKSKAGIKKGDPSRGERLKQQLRSNLRRRKQKARSAPTSPTADETGENPVEPAKSSD